MVMKLTSTTTTKTDMTMYADIEKIIKVINSCETTRHFDVAGRLIANFARSWKLNTIVNDKANPILAGLWTEVDNRLERVIYDAEQNGS